MDLVKDTGTSGMSHWVRSIKTQLFRVFQGMINGLGNLDVLRSFPFVCKRLELFKKQNENRAELSWVKRNLPVSRRRR